MRCQQLALLGGGMEWRGFLVLVEGSQAPVLRSHASPSVLLLLHGVFRGTEGWSISEQAVKWWRWPLLFIVCKGAYSTFHQTGKLPIFFSFFFLFVLAMPRGLQDLSGGSVVKNPPANAGDAGLIPESGKIPWRRRQQPSPVFLPGKSHRCAEE